MEEVLNTIHEWQSSATLDEKRDAHQHNLLRAMAKSIAERARVICFDEIQMPDPASAVFIHSLFGYLFRYGAVVVATSNRPPTDLCMQGFRSATAVKFIEMIGQKCEPLQLTSSHDYRQMSSSGYMDTACVALCAGERAGEHIHSLRRCCSNRIQAQPSPVVLYFFIINGC